MLLKISKLKFILVFVFFSIITSFSTYTIFYYFNIELVNRLNKDSYLISFIKMLLIAPFIETLVFQYIPIKLLKKIVNTDFIILIIASLLFGFAHYFNDFLLHDVITTSIAGFIYAYSFILAMKRSDMNAFLTVSLIHLGHNLFVFLIKLI